MLSPISVRHYFLLSKSIASCRLSLLSSGGLQRAPSPPLGSAGCWCLWTGAFRIGCRPWTQRSSRGPPSLLLLPVWSEGPPFRFWAPRLCSPSFSPSLVRPEVFRSCRLFSENRLLLLLFFRFPVFKVVDFQSALCHLLPSADLDLTALFSSFPRRKFGRLVSQFPSVLLHAVSTVNSLLSACAAACKFQSLAFLFSLCSTYI